MVIANITDMNLIEPNARGMRKVCMIRYSQENLEKYPDRKDFAAFFLKAYLTLRTLR